MNISLTPKQREARRKQAIQLLKKGKPFRQVAEEVGASLSSVVRWNQAYRAQGKKGLKLKAPPGRPAQLSAKQKQKLPQLLSQGAQSFGYSTDLWTLPRIAKLIQSQFGVSYHPSHVWRLMFHQLGWSSQKPERRALQRDEEAIRRWKKNKWPRLKKSPAP